MVELCGPYVFIVNPQSAAGATRRRFERVRSRYQTTLPSMEVKLTERPGHATELAREAVRRGASAVIAVGGDGTNNEVINGFFDEKGERIPSKTAFGVVTSGTGGDFRRTFGWPLDPLADLARFERDERVAIDVGRVRYTKPDGSPGVRCFVNIGDIGAVGTVVNEVNHATKAFGTRASFVVGAIKGLLKYKPRKVRMTVDDGAPEELRITAVAVANGKYFGGGMKMAPDALPDDGRFDLIVVRDASAAYLIKHGLKIYSGTHLALPEISAQRCTKVSAEPLDGEVLIELDGEQPGRLPATFELCPRAVELIR